MAYSKKATKAKAAKKVKRGKPKDTLISDLLFRHLGRVKPEDLNISERQFPFRVRADLQKAVEKVIGGGASVRQFCGVRQPHSFEGLDFTALMIHHDHYPPLAVPPQYEEIDIGEEKPVRCLKVGLWLLERDGTRYAVLLSPSMQHGMAIGVRFQIATFNDGVGARITDQFFSAMERAVNECRSYRGKILSLEQEHAYTGKSTGIKVHKLQTVEREQVILP